jgi:hypothetical protein
VDTDDVVNSTLLRVTEKSVYGFTSLFDPTKSWEIYTAESGSCLVFQFFSSLSLTHGHRKEMRLNVERSLMSNSPAQPKVESPVQPKIDFLPCSRTSNLPCSLKSNLMCSLMSNSPAQPDIESPVQPKVKFYHAA